MPIELTQPDEGTQNHRIFLHRRRVCVLQLQLHAMGSGHKHCVSVLIFSGHSLNRSSQWKGVGTAEFIYLWSVYSACLS